MTTAKLPCLPASSRRMLCELRVVRVSDGRVISSASAIATCGNIGRLAKVLVGEFGRDGKIPIGVSIIAVSLSNREGTDQGLLLAETMTGHVVSALKRASKFKFLKQIDHLQRRQSAVGALVTQMAFVAVFTSTASLAAGSGNRLLKRIAC